MKSLKHFLPPKTRHRLKWKLRRMSFPLREATAGSRALPGFLIIGAMKAGTSSLHAQIFQHPQFARSFQKEIHFFNLHFDRGERWYRAHFPMRSRVSGDRVTGEATPGYLFDPRAAQRIRDLVPDAKLIAVLRDPVERAISHVFHTKRRAGDERPILQALEEEEQTLANSLARGDYTSREFIHHSYKRRGLYLEQLERFWALFPRDQLMVLCFEEYAQDPAAALPGVFEFLGIDPGFRIPNLAPENVGSNRTDVPPEAREHLRRFFTEPNEALFEALGRRFPW